MDQYFLKYIVKRLEILPYWFKQVFEAETEQSEYLVHYLQVLDVDDLDDLGHYLLFEIEVGILSEIFDEAD